jgi:Dolichyl-phosphate-mannose-protein mannosyltransferase
VSPALRTTLIVTGLAVFITVLNALKPPVIDDPAFLSYARHFADHPSQPYAFTYYGKPANDNLVPPMLPAWLACGIPLVGDDPVALKLWLFPILLLYVASLFALLRRFAPGMQTPFLVLTVLSPALLPSINVMLDIPVLAFGLGAVALYMRAVDRRSLPLALLAGLLAGVAMETKYTGFVLPALFLVHAWQHGHWRLAIAAAGTATASFASCEAWIACAHGDSHFVLAMFARKRADHAFRLPRLVAAAVSLLGGLGSILMLIGMTALGAFRRSVLLGLAGIITGFTLIVIVPDSLTTLIRYDDTRLLTVSNVVFVPMGLAFAAVLYMTVRRLPLLASDADERRTDRVLIGWLILEMMCYLGISPFPAVRRLFGILIVSTLLIGRLASRTCQRSEPGRRIALLTVVGALAGLAFYGVELRDALAERESFRGAVQFVRDREPDARIRFVGSWGFVYHSEREGLAWSPSWGEDVRPGEWLIHDPRDGMQLNPETARHLEWMGTVAVDDWLPISTQKTFYESRTPLMHHEKAHGIVEIYRRRSTPIQFD